MNPRAAAAGIASLGRNGDSMLMHVTAREVEALKAMTKAAGGEITTNPHTGLPEASFWDFLPSIIGVIGMFIPGVQAFINPVTMGLLSGGIAAAEGKPLGQALGQGLIGAATAGIGAELGPMLSGAGSAAEGAAGAAAGAGSSLAADAGTMAGAAAGVTDTLGTSANALGGSSDFLTSGLGSLAGGASNATSGLGTAAADSLTSGINASGALSSNAANGLGSAASNGLDSGINASGALSSNAANGLGSAASNGLDPNGMSPYLDPNGNTLTNAEFAKSGLVPDNSALSNFNPNGATPQNLAALNDYPTLQNMASTMSDVSDKYIGTGLGAAAKLGGAGLAGLYLSQSDKIKNAPPAGFTTPAYQGPYTFIDPYTPATGPATGGPEQSYFQNPQIKVGSGPQAGTYAWGQQPNSSVSPQQMVASGIAAKAGGLMHSFAKGGVPPPSIPAQSSVRGASSVPYAPSQPTSPFAGLSAIHAQTHLRRGGMSASKTEGYLNGPGDGMSDSIHATIDEHQPAKLADGEFVMPADVVSHLGNGSSKAGAKTLYAMMDRIRHARTGNPKQGKQINPHKFLPA